MPSLIREHQTILVDTDMHLFLVVFHCIRLEDFDGYRKDLHETDDSKFNLPMCSSLLRCYHVMKLDIFI